MSHVEIDAGIKWAAWSAEEENWPDGWDALRAMQPYDIVEISTSSRKECRSGHVWIRRTENGWEVNGHFTEYWDEVYDLANTLGQVLVGHDDWKKYFGDWDCRSQPVEQLKRYLKDTYGYSEGEALERDARRLQVNDPDAFAESIPFSYHAMDPGVDRDFEFEFDGSVEELMARIDEEEDKLVAESSQLWNELEELFHREG